MAIEFDGGSKQYLRGAADFNHPLEGTLSLWIIPKSGSGTQKLIGTGSNFQFRLSGGLPGARLYSSSFVSASTALTNNVLYNIVVTYAIAGGGTQTTMQFYINGVIDSSGTVRRSAPSNGPLTIGYVLINPKRWFTGIVQDVRYYDRVLANHEMEVIYYSRGSNNAVYGIQNRWYMLGGYPGQIVSGTGSVKDWVEPPYNLSPIASPVYREGDIKRSSTSPLV